jgi:mannose-6-phosphate isomerase-like protein (cupin superfamily)/ribosomal protein S18 acetylase RimI-like enzyme
VETLKSVINAEHYSWGDNCDGWILHNTGEMSLIQEKMLTGTSEELHYHVKSDQIFYILEGEAGFETLTSQRFLIPEQSVYVPKRTLHKISNENQKALRFLVFSKPHSHGDKISIIPFTNKFRTAIKELNIEWLEQFFKVEPIDLKMLNDPENEILNKGGRIYYAKDNEIITGTYSLLKITDKTYELGKMAVTSSARGNGTGNALMQHCLYISQQMGIEKLVLYSNRKLHPAIHLYTKFGFIEVPMEKSYYKRANIKMEKVF